MTQFLPPNLLALFAPRDPIPFLPPLDKQLHEKKRLPYGGIAEYLGIFEDPKDTPPIVKLETREERKERKLRERLEVQTYKIEQGIALWEPAGNPKSTTDPYKTLFVARINYDTTESKLKREFEAYGPVRKVHMTYDKTNAKPRGYAFIEYEHERDMHAAYKKADGKKIDGRRVLVDVERGRTVKGWLPRRLGGGLGNTRKAKPPAGEDEVRGPSRERSEQRREKRRSRSKSGSRRRSRDRSRDRSSRRDKDRETRGGGDRENRGERESRGGGDRDRERNRERSDRGSDRDRRRDEPQDKDRSRENRGRNEHPSSGSNNFEDNGQY